MADEQGFHIRNDPQEDIERCLSCEKAECTNCLYNSLVNARKKKK